MKSIFVLLWYVVFGLLVLIACSCEKPTTIKSSQIDDAAITEPKLYSCGIGIKRDQKTGDTVELMYKGKSYVPVHKDTVFISLVEPPSKLDKPIFDPVAHRKVTVEQGWENDKCWNTRYLITRGWYKGCIVYSYHLAEKIKEDDQAIYNPYGDGIVKKITPLIVYAEREKAANFMISYVRKMKGKECNE